MKGTLVMASKDEMLSVVEKTYDKNRDLFDFARIKQETYLKWWGALKNYDDVRKAYRFVTTRLLKEVTFCRYVHDKYKRTVNWPMQLLTLPHHYTVKEFRVVLNQLRAVWGKRPIKRKSE